MFSSRRYGGLRQTQANVPSAAKRVLQYFPDSERESQSRGFSVSLSDNTPRQP